jgi:hypothetical protein
MRSTDIKICRTPEGKKCRLGEGGFGVVYKAVIHGVDEVAVKLAKVRFDQIRGRHTQHQLGLRLPHHYG